MKYNFILFSLDHIRPDNDARVPRVRGGMHRYQIMAGADGIIHVIR